MHATLGVFTFLGDCLEDEFHVLSPEGDPLGFGALNVLLSVAHRVDGNYEADTFAAEFVGLAAPRAHMTTRQRVRLMPSGDWWDVAPAEVRFRYAISPGKAKDAGEIMAIVYAVSPIDPDRRNWNQEKLAAGRLADVLRWAEREREKASIKQAPRARTRTTPIGAPHARR